MRSVQRPLQTASLAALVVLILLAACTTAPARLVIYDESETLDRSQVEQAAAPLQSRGATVAVIVIAHGDESGDEITRHLDEAQLLANGQIADEALAIYVSYNPRYSEIRAGSRWSKRLPDSALRATRTTLLNPALRDEALTRGVATTLRSLEAQIASPPLIERIWTTIGALMIVGLVLSALALSPAGVWLGRWWSRSPPGRLAQWLIDQTPPGRRRLERIIRTTRLRLEDRVEYAHSYLRAIPAGPQYAELVALKPQLKILDQRREQLLNGAQQDRTLLDALDHLAWEYERLGHTAARLKPTAVAPRAKQKKHRDHETAVSSFSETTSSAAASAPSDNSSSESTASWDSWSTSDSGPSSDGGSW